VPRTHARLDVRAVVKTFGGQAELCRKLNERTDRIKVGSIEQWCLRGSIPGPWLVELTALARREGIRFVLDDFITHPRASAPIAKRKTA
jgi:hypothetical protein